MRPSGSWSRRFVAVGRPWTVALVVMVMGHLLEVPCGAQVAIVQIPENAPPEAPIQLASFYVSPIFELKNVGIDTNVFNDDAEDRDFTATPAAGMTAVSLFGPMRFTGVLDTEYVWFQKFRSERSFNSAFDLRFEGFFDRLRPWVTGGRARTRERRGLEIDVRARRTQPTLAAGLDWVVGSRTALAISTRVASLAYADSEQADGQNLSEQLDNTTHTYTAGLRFELTPLTMLLVDGQFATTRFTGNQVRDNDSWSVRPRLLLQPDAYISGELMVGFKTLAPKDPLLARFSGVISRGALTMSLLDVTQFQVAVERDTEYSFDPLHPYYVQTGATVTITQQIGGPFDVEVSFGRYDLRYHDLPDPISGPRGTERLTRGGFGVRYRLGETIRVAVDSQLENRRSIVSPGRDYDRIIIMALFPICCSVGTPPRLARVAALLIGVACAGLQLMAQEPARTDYLIGPKDTLKITVFGEDDLSAAYTVDADGSITFPFLGRVSVDGLTLGEIQDEITSRLADGFIVSPQVSSEIGEYRRQSVYVLGEVGNPGIYRLSGNLSLIEVLVNAGGATAQAGNEVHIIRSASGRLSAGPVLREGDDPEVEVTVVSLEDIRSGRLALVPVRDGDTVNVPRAATFFVTGHVSSPGSYVWIRGMTVRQAIATAGGYTPRGSSRGIRISRMVDDTATEVGVTENDLIQPDDTLTIRARRF